MQGRYVVSGPAASAELLFRARLREALKATEGIVDVSLVGPFVDLDEVFGQGAWEAAADDDDHATIDEFLTESADRLFWFFFDNNRPGGSWVVELLLLLDTTTRAFAFERSDDMGTQVALLEAPSVRDLGVLASRVLIERVTGPTMMSFPSEVRSGVGEQAMVGALVQMLLHQRESGYGFSGGAEGLPSDATLEEIEAFVRSFMSTR